jgi:hypothetical protein
MNAIAIQFELQPEPNCFCSVGEPRRPPPRSARLVQAVNNWRQQYQEQPDIYFGKAAE